MRDERKMFEEWYRNHRSEVKGFVRMMAKDGEVLDDLLQETWATVWAKINTFDPSSCHETTWICGIAKFVVLRHLAKARRIAHYEVPLTETLEENLESVDRMETEVEADDERERAFSKASLSEMEERAVRMSLKGMGVADIAAVTGANVRSVSSAKNRGIAKVKKALAA